jgi:hypothetical protein
MGLSGDRFRFQLDLALQATCKLFPAPGGARAFGDGYIVFDERQLVRKPFHFRALRPSAGFLAWLRPPGAGGS